MDRIRASSDVPRDYDATAAASAGLLSGFLAGVVLGMIMMLGEVAVGRGPWAGLRDVAAVFLGPGAEGRVFAPGPVLVGVLAHLGLSMTFGLAFGLLAYRWSKETVLWASLVWGLMIYGFMLLVALPVVAPLMVRNEIGFVPALMHSIFGLVIGAFYLPLRRRVEAPRLVEERRGPPPTTTEPTLTPT